MVASGGHVLYGAAMSYQKLIKQIKELETHAQKALDACSGLDGVSYEKKEIKHILEVLPSMLRRLQAKDREKAKG